MHDVEITPRNNGTFTKAKCSSDLNCIRYLLESDVSPPSIYPFLCFPDGSSGKESACNAGDTGLISGTGRFPGEENILT